MNSFFFSFEFRLLFGIIFESWQIIHGIFRYIRLWVINLCDFFIFQSSLIINDYGWLMNPWRYMTKRYFVVTSSNRRTKITKFRWKIRNVRFKMTDPAGTENRGRSRKTHTKTPQPQPEREHPAIEVSPKSPCGAIALGRRPSYQRNPKNGPRDEETQKFACFACAT